MNKQEKNQKVAELTALLNENKNFYLADTSTITGIKINQFRRICFEKNVNISVVKNSLLQKAMEKSDNAAAFTELHSTLIGNTAILTVASQATLQGLSSNSVAMVQNCHY